MQFTNWKHWAVGSVAALTLMTGSMLTADSVSAAPVQVEPAEQQAGPRGWGKTHHGFGPVGERGIDGQALFAEALGVSVEELVAAQETAHQKTADEALAKAVKEGRITQEQADAINVLKGRFGGRLHGRFPMAFGNHETYLADELEISVEELQAAKDVAMQAGLEQAVTDGTITQEQADDMQAMKNLREYLAEELDGELAEAVQKAVADGVITRDQADRFLERANGFLGDMDHGPRGSFDGRHGRHGGLRGDFDAHGQDLVTPESQSGNGRLFIPNSQL